MSQPNPDKNEKPQKKYTRRDLFVEGVVGTVIGLPFGAFLLQKWSDYQLGLTQFSLSDNNWQSPQDGVVVDTVDLVSRSILTPDSEKAGWIHVSTDYTAVREELPKIPLLSGDPYQGSEGILRGVPNEYGITTVSASLLDLGGIPGKVVHFSYNVHGERRRGNKIERASIDGKTGRRKVFVASRGGGN